MTRRRQCPNSPPGSKGDPGLEGPVGARGPSGLSNVRVISGFWTDPTPPVGQNNFTHSNLWHGNHGGSL